MLAQARLAGARVKGSQTLVENVQPALDKHRRMIVIEGVFNVAISPASGRHFNFTDFVFPNLVAGSEVKNMQKRMAFEPIVGAALRVFGKHNSQQIGGRIDCHLHDSAANLIGLPDGVAGQQIDSFNASAFAFLKTEQQQIGIRHRRHVSFVQ